MVLSVKEKKPLNVEIGQNVKRVREQSGLTQESLGELIGLGEKHISSIERGAVGVSLPTLKRLCTLLAVPADAILFGTAEANGREERDAAHQIASFGRRRISSTNCWKSWQAIRRKPALRPIRISSDGMLPARPFQCLRRCPPA